jgi:hypothetical protein
MCARRPVICADTRVGRDGGPAADQGPRYAGQIEHDVLARECLARAARATGPYGCHPRIR